MLMPVQLSLPLKPRQHFVREDFIVGPGNRQAVEFLDLWPAWPAPAAVLYGPPGSGKTHLAQVWAEQAGAHTIEAADITEAVEIPQGAMVVENAGPAPLCDAAERTLFALIERGAPLLLTSREPPQVWQVTLPDLMSRTRSLLRSLCGRRTTPYWPRWRKNCLPSDS